MKTKARKRTKSDEKPLRAFSVTEEDEGHSEIVFERAAIAARRIGALRLDTEFEYVTCRRAPEFDEYAETGWIPNWVKIEAGWWFDCHGCPRRVQEDMEDDEGTPVGPPVFVGKQVFCCEDCRLDHLAEVKRVNDEFHQFKIDAPLKIPSFCRITKFSGGYPLLSPSAEFWFPGQKHGANIRKSEDGSKFELWVANGDQERFKELDGTEVSNR